MRRFFFYTLLLLPLSCSTGFQARMLLSNAEDSLLKAETVGGREYAPDQMNVARGGIRNAERLLREGRDQSALEAAKEARIQASEAFRIARSSRAAVSLKNARDALKLVRENGAESIHGDVYDHLLSSLEQAERKFMADQSDSSYENAQEAVYQSEILLGPLRKEAEQKRENILKLLEGARQAGRNPTEIIESLRREAEEAYAVKHYQKATFLWDKIDREIQGM